MTSNSIQISQLTKIFYPEKKAVDELDLEVRKGEIFALLGPNGAGKSTTIRVLSTLCGFDSGKVHVAGLDVDADPEKVRQTIGVVAQKTGVDYFLTGRENLVLQGHLYRMNKNDITSRIDELAKYFELEDSLDKLVSTYSGGMTRKLDIATALMHHPEILFLDEPTLGLDIRSRKSLWKYIEELNKESGLTILLTTHYLEEADSLSDRVAIINNGKIQVIGTPDELKNQIKGDSITVTFEQVDKNAQAFAYQAGQDELVKSSLWDGNNLHLYMDDGASCIAKLMAMTVESNVEIKNLSLSRPSLDDVFLKFTGTSMQGEEEEPAEQWWTQWAGKDGGKWKKQWEESANNDQDNSEEDNEPSWQGNEWNSGKDSASSWPNQNWNNDEEKSSWQDNQKESNQDDAASGSETSWPKDKNWEK